jgi:hypothetical protein
MYRIKTCIITTFLLFFAALAWSQNPREESKPPQEPGRQEEAKPEPRNEAAPPRHQNDARPPQQEEAKPPKSEKEENAKPPREESKPAHEQHGQQPEKGQAAQSGHARPSGKSAHIPDPTFKANFGRQHTVRVNRIINTTTIVPGQTQFVLTGFTFIILDPWPAEWLFTDDVFIDFVGDDYFLVDVFHPGVRIALFVVG